MLRVGYVFERFPSFGQTFCYREVAELERQGIDVALFSIRRPEGEPPQDWDERLVRKVHYLPDEKELVKQVETAARKGDLPAEAARRIREWGKESDFLRLQQAAYIGLRLRAAGIERVHAHFAGMAARTAYWLREFFGIRYSVTAHANDIFAPRAFVVSLAKIFAGASAVVTVSDFAVAALRQQFPEQSAKVHRVYNGVEMDAFARAEFTEPVPLIVSVGRLIEKKGFPDLIRACAILHESRHAFRCEIIGEGPLDAELSAQISAAGLNERVRLLGPRTQSQIAQRLATATVFALPCVKEREGGMDNLPTVIMEAMATGLPVVSTPIAGVPEMVQPGLTGELVPEHNPPALAAAIERILSDRDLAVRYGSAGRELAEKKFSTATNVRALADILRNT